MSRTALWIIIGALSFLVVVLAIFLALPKNNSTNPTVVQQQQSQTQPQTNQFAPRTFQNNRTPYFVSSTPSSNQVLTAAPTQVKLVFNTILDPNQSRIMVKNVDNNQEVSAGTATLSSDQKTMTTGVTINQTGNYQVDYTACFPSYNNACYNGSFGFSANLTGSGR